MNDLNILQISNLSSKAERHDLWLRISEGLWQQKKDFRMHNATVVYLEHISILTCMRVSNIYVYSN